jgi:hypothetical protein
MAKNKFVRIPVKLALRIFDYLQEASGNAMDCTYINKSLEPLERILLKRGHLVMISDDLEELKERNK